MQHTAPGANVSKLKPRTFYASLSLAVAGPAPNHNPTRNPWAVSHLHLRPSAIENQISVPSASISGSLPSCVPAPAPIEIQNSKIENSKEFLRDHTFCVRDHMVCDPIKGEMKNESKPNRRGRGMITHADRPPRHTEYMHQRSATTKPPRPTRLSPRDPSQKSESVTWFVTSVTRFVTPYRVK